MGTHLLPPLYQIIINGQPYVFHPDPHPEITSVDGMAGQAESNPGVDWSVLIAAAGNRSEDSQTEQSIVYIQSGTGTDKWIVLHRYICLFDTSKINPNAEIIEAILSIYSDGKNDNLAISPNVNVYASAPGSNTGVNDGDYDSLGSVAFCDSAKSYADWITGGYNHFILNAAGIAAIDKSGITKLGLRNANYDVAGVAPTWVNSPTQQSSYFNAYLANEGVGYWPLLTVKYRM